MIINNKYGIYELPLQFLNDLILKTRKLGNIKKISKPYRIIALVLSFLPKIKILSIPVKNSLKTEIKLFPWFAISFKNYCLSQIFCPWL